MDVLKLLIVEAAGRGLALVRRHDGLVLSLLFFFLFLFLRFGGSLLGRVIYIPALDHLFAIFSATTPLAGLQFLTRVGIKVHYRLVGDYIARWTN